MYSAMIFSVDSERLRLMISERRDMACFFFTEWKIKREEWKIERERERSREREGVWFCWVFK
jgi:hypothetical protein